MSSQMKDWGSPKDTSVAYLASRPVFLHFCDREFLTLFGAYHRGVPAALLTRDVRAVLLATFEPALFATSLLFESRFAKQLLSSAPVLFQRGHIQLVLGALSLQDFVFAKQEQYGHARSRYPFYFDDFWKHVLQNGPLFRQKFSDTTQTLGNTIIIDMNSGGLHETAQRLNVASASTEIDRLAPYAVEAIDKRGSRAVTRALFQSLYTNLSATDAGKRAFDVKVTEHFVRAYLADLQATLATGLSTGLSYFDYLSPTYPFHDLRIWREVYAQLGMTKFVAEAPLSALVSLREDPVFHSFVVGVREFIGLLRRRESGGARKDTFIAEIERAIRIHLRVDSRAPKSVGDAFKTLERATDCLYSADLVNLDVSRKRWRGDAFPVRNNVVFVAYGRDTKARASLFALLRAGGVNPREFEQLVIDHGGEASYVGEIIDLALKEAAAIIVLFTPDERAELKSELLEVGEKPETYEQPRPNVILEAGMALAHRPKNTIIVQIGRVRQISDLAGRHILHLNNAINRRKALLQRIEAAGCVIDISGDDWMTAGEFPE